jgi:hypothetical protein
MPFASYTSISDVAHAYQITVRLEDFIVPLERPVSEYLRSELAFAQAYVGFADGSEFAVCENLIYPVLKEVWKSYTDHLILWSHIPLNYDEDLSGTPDYVLCRRSPLGPWVLDNQPCLLVMEAKKDDFARGWGQCLAAMLAAQKRNAWSEQTLFGITTNGHVWEFGKLHAATFTQDLRRFPLHELDELCAAVNYLFEQCRQQVVGLVGST